MIGERFGLAAPAPVLAGASSVEHGRRRLRRQPERGRRRRDVFATRTRQSPLAYSISVNPVSASTSASWRTTSMSSRRVSSSASWCTSGELGRHAGGADQPLRRRLQRQLIAEAAEAANHAVRRQRDVGVVAEMPRAGRCSTGAPRSPARRRPRAHRAGRSRCGCRRRH